MHTDGCGCTAGERCPEGDRLAAEATRLHFLALADPRHTQAYERALKTFNAHVARAMRRREQEPAAPPPAPSPDMERAKHWLRFHRWLFQQGRYADDATPAADGAIPTFGSP